MNKEQRQNIITYLDSIDIALEQIQGAIADIRQSRKFIVDELYRAEYEEDEIVDGIAKSLSETPSARIKLTEPH